MCVSSATELKPATAAAFDRYVSAAEARIDARLRGSQFLWADDSPARLKALREGQVVVEPVAGEGDVAVAGGLVHD